LEEFGEQGSSWEMAYDDLSARYAAASDSDTDCPYCHKGKPLVDDNVSFVAVDNNAGQLWFNSDKFVGHDEAAFVNIAYCPMCGRRLDDRDV
jgi:hypothetical protein